MSTEDKTRACYEKALALKKAGQYADAIKVLDLSERGVYWGPLFIQCFDMLAELSFSQLEGTSVISLEPAFKWVKSKLRGSQHLEDGTEKVMEITMGHARAFCERARVNAKQLSTAPADADIVLAALSGVPVDIVAHDRYLLPMQVSMSRLAKMLFHHSTIGNSKKLHPIFLRTASVFIDLCREFELRSAVDTANKFIVWTLERLVLEPIPPMQIGDNKQGFNNRIKEQENDRGEFLQSDTLGKDTVRLLCALLASLSAMSRWSQVWTTLSLLKRISDVLGSVKKSQESKIMAYKAMSAAFWVCGNTGFHAHCLCMAACLATGEECKALASRALLATLCCAYSSDDVKGFPSVSSFGSDDSISIEKLFDFSPAAHQAPVDAMRFKHVFEHARPSVQELYRSIRFFEVKDWASLHKMSAMVCDEEASERQYKESLCNIIVRRQLEIFANRCTRTDMSSLVTKDNVDSTDFYVTMVEPAILSNNAFLVDIDSKTQSISFRNTTKEKMLSAYAHLAERVDVRPACKAVKPTVTISDLLEAHNRTSDIHALQTACWESVAERISKRARMIEEERQMKKTARQNEEIERRRATRMALENKLLAEYRERQRQERCKLVLKKLRAKYPGFTVDESIARKPASVFEDELTHLLAAFKRKGSEGERRDAARCNLYERALRQTEIPKRRQQDAANAERHREERAAARENFLEQHRKEFEKRQQEKMVLQRFVADAAAFEEQWRKLSMQEKGSKRDEQQSLLQQEMQRLAAQK